jgi:hypothetical protein
METILFIVVIILASVLITLTTFTRKRVENLDKAWVEKFEKEQKRTDSKMKELGLEVIMLRTSIEEIKNPPKFKSGDICLLKDPGLYQDPDSIKIISVRDFVLDTFRKTRRYYCECKFGSEVKLLAIEENELIQPRK